MSAAGKDGQVNYKRTSDMLTIINRGGQIRWISSLRGMLVFLVFFSHLAVLPIHKDLLFIIGRIGVAGFFLISGYLAVTSLERRNVKQFLFNRFMRLYPVYWILLLMTFFLTEGHDSKELMWNMTLFEEFVGYEAMIGASWMLPIMVVFFVLLTALQRKMMKVDWLYYATCAGSLCVGALRYWTGRPFPTALCLLMCVGLVGYTFKLRGRDKALLRMIVMFEVTLITASALSYGEKVYWYFIAYNLGFAAFFLFERFNLGVKAFDKLGELGFTFFLGAGIPIKLVAVFVPSIRLWNCYVFSLTKFVLAIALSYVITQWCEKPLLAWGKRVEKRL